MHAWLNWRVALASIAIGTMFSAGLFLATDRAFALSGLDLFFAITTVISLGFNLWQLFRDRYKYEPLRNALIGLFNDLKNRQLRAYQRQQLILSPAGQSATAEAVRLEFYDFADETRIGLEQLREHVTAAIHTLDPSASSHQVFRAAEFGLNAQERQFREEGMQRFIENSRPASAPPVTSPHPPGA